MKIAVTYDNGNVFQHFGKSKEFKVYDIQDGKVVEAAVYGTDGAGHEELASVLAQNGVDVLICGGLGDGAQAALAQANIQVVSGAEGDADEAVAAFLLGELESQGVNCGDHEESSCCGGDESCDCGGDCGDECGGGCGGCGGGCGGGELQIVLEGKNAGKKVKTHYRGTLDDGTQFDASYDRGEPLEFICGAGMMIPGYDKAVVDMNVGDVVDVHLEPEDAYGQADPNAIFTIPFEQLPGSEELTVGQRVYLQNQFGQPFPVTVTAKDDTAITFDANHELAGKALNFHIELVEVLD